MLYKHYYKFSLTALVLAATVVFAQPSSAALTTYTQNFEGMTPNQGFSDPTATPPFVNDLDADGWQIYGIVYDANPYAGPANITGEYGPFAAANGDPGSIQGVATGQGGPLQGDVVLAKYSDYNNPDQVGSYVAASTYQEQTVGAGDVGSIWRFGYDAKMGNLEADSSAFAYILTQDFNTGGETFVSRDSTNLPIEWLRYNIDLFITPDMVGDNLSFGFVATSTEYNGSGVFYDNISFAQVPVPAAVWLFGSALGLLGWMRRKTT